MVYWSNLLVASTGALGILLVLLLALKRDGGALLARGFRPGDRHARLLAGCLARTAGARRARRGRRVPTDEPTGPPPSEEYERAIEHLGSGRAEVRVSASTPSSALPGTARRFGRQPWARCEGTSTPDARSCKTPKRAVAPHPTLRPPRPCWVACWPGAENRREATDDSRWRRSTLDVAKSLWTLAPFHREDHPAEPCQVRILDEVISA